MRPRPFPALTTFFTNNLLRFKKKSKMNTYVRSTQIYYITCMLHSPVTSNGRVECPPYVPFLFGGQGEKKRKENNYEP